MTALLTPQQRTRLEAALQQRQAALDAQLAEQQGGASRVEMAAELRAEDAHDSRERDAEREVALARADRELAELGQVSAALRRVHAPDFGFCADCGEAIRFERLLAEPWATRCVTCASAAEGHQSHPKM